LQWFEDADGNVTRSGMKEPKQMHWDGINYHQHAGGTAWHRFKRDPTSLWEHSTNATLIRWKKRYGTWRKFKCRRFGPVEAVWRVRWFTSRPYEWYRISIGAMSRGWIWARQKTKPLRARVRRFVSGPPTRVVVLA
jgi:hypothetical protein